MSTRLKKYEPDPISALCVQMDQMRVLMHGVPDIAENPDENPGLTGTLLYMLHDKFQEMDRSLKAYMKVLFEEIENRRAA